jgi:dihydroxy-acid dehydratase
MVVPAAEASHAPKKDDLVPEDYDISKPIKSNSGLRKGLTSYGDAHFSLFLRKVFIKALGYSEDALSRPIIGVINTYSSFSPCHGTVPQLVEAVKRGVQLHGGLCIDFPTISLHESFASPTSMFLRNLMSMDTEEMIRAQPVDVCIMIGGAFYPGLLNWCGNVLNAQQVVTRLSLPNSWVDSHPTSLSCH